MSEQSVRALADGRQWIVSKTESLVRAATQSEDPLLFYAGCVAALLGTVAAALGGEAVDGIMEVVRPMVVQVSKEREKPQEH